MKFFKTSLQLSSSPFKTNIIQDCNKCKYCFATLHQCLWLLHEWWNGIHRESFHFQNLSALQMLMHLFAGTEFCLENPWKGFSLIQKALISVCRPSHFWAKFFYYTLNNWRHFERLIKIVHRRELLYCLSFWTAHSELSLFENCSVRNLKRGTLSTT